MNGRGRLTWIGADLLEESLESLISKFRLGGVSDVTK